SRIAYPDASDGRVKTPEHKPGAITNVVDDARIGRCLARVFSDKNRLVQGLNRRRLGDIISFDGPVVAAGNTYSYPADFENRAFCYTPAVALACDRRVIVESGGEIVLHVNRQAFEAPVVSVPPYTSGRRHRC